MNVHNDLYHNILPFWMKHSLDDEYGGFWGAITNDLVIKKDAPKSCVVCARILWTYAAATRIAGNSGYLDMAKRAWQYLEDKFWDPDHSGLFWWLDYRGQPLVTDKKIYGQAFTIYALAEYRRTTQNARSLARAKEIYYLIEEKGADPTGQGYFDFFQRDWSPLGAAKLDVDGLDADKTMNTHLHLLEAYTNLYRVWPVAELEGRLRELLSIFLEKIIDAQTWHFNLFFNKQWQPLSDYYSYGHDIEGSWLLVEAAEVLGDEKLLARVQEVAVNMARATLREGAHQGAIMNEGRPDRVLDSDKHWWPQAEGVVGFLNAYQLTQDPTFFKAAYDCWRFIEETLIDKQYGEWFWRASAEGKIYPENNKVDPWKGPYHNSRACFEILARLAQI
ncbi:MAG: AGE family epimerase/isomerase [Anaerolineae bacterium]|nr:AGE family epimerase/isomerase [Anaerolineae bacterium]